VGVNSKPRPRTRGVHTNRPSSFVRNDAHECHHRRRVPRRRRPARVGREEGVPRAIRRRPWFRPASVRFQTRATRVMTKTRFFDAMGETRVIRVDDSTVRDSQKHPPPIEERCLSRTGRSDRVDRAFAFDRDARLARASATFANASRKFRFIWFPHRERHGWTGERIDANESNRSVDSNDAREDFASDRTDRVHGFRDAKDDAMRCDAMRNDYTRRDRSSSFPSRRRRRILPVQAVNLG